MNPTSPNRRAHMLQAHALRARGYTIAQIAELTKHAPSTVHAWLKDLEAKRQYFISAFAQDQLLVLLHDEAELLRYNQLHPPKDADEAIYRNQQTQTYTAVARELRMVCAQLSRTALAVYGGPEDEHLTPDEVDAITHATTLQEQLPDLLQSPPPPDNSEQSEATQTHLEISEFPETESPVEDGKSANSAPEKSSSEFHPQSLRAGIPSPPAPRGSLPQRRQGMSRSDLPSPPAPRGEMLRSSRGGSAQAKIHHPKPHSIPIQNGHGRVP